MEIVKGSVIAKKDIGDMIKQQEFGIITAYLPDDNTFAVYLGDKRWYTFHQTEKEFLENFNVNLDVK